VYSLCAAGMVMISIFFSHAVTVMAENAPLEREWCIVLDAGHGGVDGGAVSCTGKPESMINLEITIRLRDLLHLLGYETKMIRTSDTSVYTQGNTIAQKKISDLKERVRIVQDTQNAVLISIHQNTFTDSIYRGAQIFYNENKQSKILAEKIQESICVTINKGSNRKSKPSKGVYLMENADCIGILAECGFISNPEEEQKLNDPVYQNKLVCVISSAISLFLDCT